ncbi:hypothetical protein LP420_10665 [Massilia sp. B-10]|nr:hypothetical protein LP420_10665 [Massilia sp. B-10]
MPELKSHYGYPAALAFMFGLCGYLYYRFQEVRLALSAAAIDRATASATLMPSTAADRMPPA